MAFGTRVGRSLTPAIVTLLLITLINSISLGRASSSSSSSSSSSCNGSFNGCLVADEAPDFELLMDSHKYSRMLLDPAQAYTAGTGNRNQPANSCGGYEQYESCLPDPNSPRVHKDCRSIYNRVCGKLMT